MRFFLLSADRLLDPSRAIGEWVERTVGIPEMEGFGFFADASTLILGEIREDETAAI